MIRPDITFLSFAPNAPADNYWSHTFLKDILEDLPEEHERHIFVIPGEYQNDYINDINKELSAYSKVLVIITADECNVFDTTKLEHPDMIIYSQFPTRKSNANVDFWLPLGYTPNFREMQKNLGMNEKVLDWFFAGQITHKSRRKLVEQLKQLTKAGELIETDGFAKGLDPDVYAQKMNIARVVPCPSGPASPESFRMYEALEAGCIPIPENKDMFEMLFMDSPLTILDSWGEVNNYITNFSERFPELNNKVFAWWQLQKRNIKHRFMHDLGIDTGRTTVMIPTSPIKMHPDTSMIEKTIEDVRSRIDCEILIMIDGVREEQTYLMPQYQEYIRRLLWKCNYEWKDVIPVLFSSHHHQAAMAKETMPLVDTPTILYVEHDAPLTPDMDYDWNGIFNLVNSGKANIVRFHFESRIPEEHKYLMLDREAQVVDGVPVIRTAQWSQRPHVASSDYYRYILNTYFSEDSRTMIEDKMHGIVIEDYKRAGRSGWNKHKIMIYAPEGNIKRSYHLDGRGAESKYDMKF